MPPTSPADALAALPGEAVELPRFHRRRSEAMQTLATCLRLLLLAWVLALPFLVLPAGASGFDPSGLMMRAHTVLEVLITALMLMAAGVAWNTRGGGQPHNLVALGIALLGASALNVAHVATFPAEGGGRLPQALSASIGQFMGGDAILVAGLLAGAFLPARLARPGLTLGLMAGLVLLAALLLGPLALLAHWQPVWWEPQQGITPAKAWADGLTAAALAAAGWALAWRAVRDDSRSYIWLAGAALVLAVGSMPMARTGPASESWVLLGHLYRLGGMLLVYLALFREGVRQPYRRLAQSERVAEQSRAHYEQLFQSSPDGLLLVDRDGVICGANAQACALFRWPLDELVGRRIEVLVPESVRGRHVGLRQGYQAAPRRREMAEDRALQAQRRDGSTFPAEVALVPQQSPHIDTTLCIVRDVSRRRALEESLLQQAAHDALTGLANRRHFTERMGQMLAHARRQQQQLAVMFIDLDHFKKTNDTLGHEMGDRLLCEIAARLRGALRESDLLARMGGDEFAVVLADMAHSGDANIVARKLLDLLLKPVCIDGHEMLVGASIGITLFPHDGQAAEELLRHADLAMYRAKASGRNAWCFYQPEMNERMRERVDLERDLHHALERGELSLHYQPRVRLADGALTGFEALLRWRHPTRGPIGPDVFIPIAEETGLIVPIGEWVLRQACCQARAWAAAGLPRLQVAVNVSARQLSDAAFPRRVRQALDDTGWPAELLELEITETALMQDTVLSAGLLRELKSLGARTAVDDFGTGYSSLAYLKAFPLHRLKVDRSFVAGVQDEGDDRVIASTIIVLAQSLGLQVTAEGVETAEQATCLLQHGCDEAQGYHFGRPVPAEEFEAMLRGRGA